MGTFLAGTPIKAAGLFEFSNMVHDTLLWKGERFSLVISGPAPGEKTSVSYFEITEIQGGLSPRIFFAQKLDSTLYKGFLDGYKVINIETDSIPDGDYRLNVKSFLNNGWKQNCRSPFFVTIEKPFKGRFVSHIKNKSRWLELPRSTFVWQIEKTQSIRMDMLGDTCEKLEWYRFDVSIPGRAKALFSYEGKDSLIENIDIGDNPGEGPINTYARVSTLIRSDSSRWPEEFATGVAMSTPKITKPEKLLLEVISGNPHMTEILVGEIVHTRVPRNYQFLLQTGEKNPIVLGSGEEPRRLVNVEKFWTQEKLPDGAEIPVIIHVQKNLAGFPSSKTKDSTILTLKGQYRHSIKIPEDSLVSSVVNIPVNNGGPVGENTSFLYSVQEEKSGRTERQESTELNVDFNLQSMIEEMGGFFQEGDTIRFLLKVEKRVPEMTPLQSEGSIRFVYTKRPTGIASGERGKTFVFPNPLSREEVLTIKTEESIEGNLVEIYNIHGEEILATGSIQNISMKRFPSGIYFIRTKNGKEEVWVKLILQ